MASVAIWGIQTYFSDMLHLNMMQAFPRKLRRKKNNNKTTKTTMKKHNSPVCLYFNKKAFFFFACMLHWPAFFFRSSSQSCYVNHIFIKEGKATTEEKETVKKKRTGNKYSNPDNVIWSTPQISGEKKKERCIRHLTNIRDYNNTI